MNAALTAAAAGAGLARTWADVVVANEAGTGLSRAKEVTVDLVAEHALGDGLAAAETKKDPTFVYAPGYAAADDEGYVQVPPVDPHSYLDRGSNVPGEDNVAVMRAAQQAYVGAQRLIGANG